MGVSHPKDGKRKIGWGDSTLYNLRIGTTEENLLPLTNDRLKKFGLGRQDEDRL